MKAVNVINLVKKFTAAYGVEITWREPVITLNSRGIPVKSGEGEERKASVLILKDKFTLLKPINADGFGISFDYGRFILAVPEVDIKKDLIITDAQGGKWKLGVVDYLEIGGVPVVKQVMLLEVD
jgi:hypothetical protein